MIRQPTTADREAVADMAALGMGTRTIVAELPTLGLTALGRAEVRRILASAKVPSL